ncbi:MAG: DUF87 domain-containing protein [Acidobacteriota bacterium]
MSSKVDAYEKLGAFYLGRPVDAESGEAADVPLLYDSKDLTTHAVIVGMTGSGKTGLGVTMLEEAAIDGIPALVIDPKGDLANLALTFPDLAAADFAPWVDPAKAARDGLTEQELAAREAKMWRDGLGSWNQDPERVRRLKEAAEVAIYTPGSTAGRPISILSSFAAPSPEILEDRDLLQERLTTTTVGLLGLLGIDADPIRSRECILLTSILDHAWRQGESLDLPGLIQRVQTPPFSEVGVLPLDSFFPDKDRFALAMALNNLLASPSFQSWLDGEPLDIDRLLYTEAGKPRVAVLSIAHLGDAERMFFVSLLLSQTLGWMRRRSGTSSLRAILYMDEVFGYLPPVGEPPSKRPLLTLLKQARAFGLGLVLATQNPVDLDYKALSNIGTWFLGRLQTERDKARVMDGLLTTGSEFDKGELEALISGLGKRVFLLHNVHEDGAVLMGVRWAMSYLRGPLTRDQIKALTPDLEPAPGTEAAAAPPAPEALPEGPDPESQRPVLPKTIVERFLPLRGRPGDDVLYRPGLVGAARVHYLDRKHDLEASEELLLRVTADDDEVDWYQARELQLTDDDLEKEPAGDGVRYAELPAVLGDPKRRRGLEKDFADMLYRQRRWTLFESPAFGLVSEPGEGERDFRVRLAEKAREERDREVAKLRQAHGKKVDRLEARRRRAAERVEREASQSRGQWVKAVASGVELGLSLFGVGRKRLTATKLSRAAGSVSRGFRERGEVGRAEDELERVQADLRELEAEIQEALAEVEASYDDRRLETLGEYTLKPRRTDVDVRLVAVGWAPYRVRDGLAEAAW